jgi:hypothetical protein
MRQVQPGSRHQAASLDLGARPPASFVQFGDRGVSIPLNDGDERTAWACCVVFPEVSGVSVAGPPEDMVRQVALLASRGMDEGICCLAAREVLDLGPMQHR